VEAGVSNWSMFDVRFLREVFIWTRGGVSAFLQGVDLYVLCVRVYAHTHTVCGVLG